MSTPKVELVWNIVLVVAIMAAIIMIVAGVREITIAPSEEDHSRGISTQAVSSVSVPTNSAMKSEKKETKEVTVSAGRVTEVAFHADLNGMREQLRRKLAVEEQKQ